MAISREELLAKIAQVAQIKTDIKNALSARGVNVLQTPFTDYHTKLALGNKKWIYGDRSDGDIVYSSNTAVSLVNARNITVRSNVTLTPTARLTPMILRATESITIEQNAVLSADGYGYTYSESGNNKFNLARSTQDAAGSIGISGGGGKAKGGSNGNFSGGQAVSVSTFLSYIRQHYLELLVDGNLNIIPLFGGGGATSNTSLYGRGGGCILLVAPKINFRGIGRVRGLPGNGTTGFGGHGGGGGGWIGMFGRELNTSTSTVLDACGGGGGGGAWNGTGLAGSWQNGGISPGRKGPYASKVPDATGYSTGAGGGGSTALNANGGTPGKGGAGSQYYGKNGSTNGIGGGGGNYTGSDRGGGGGAGGGAGKISWLEV